jgi:hypothetical protein
MWLRGPFDALFGSCMGPGLQNRDEWWGISQVRYEKKPIVRKLDGDGERAIRLKTFSTGREVLSISKAIDA